MVHLDGAKMIRHTWRSWPRRSKTGAALTLHAVWKGNKSFTWKIELAARSCAKLLTRIGDAQKKVFFLRKLKAFFCVHQKGGNFNRLGVQGFFGLSVSAVKLRMLYRPLLIDYISCVYVCYTSKDAMYTKIASGLNSPCTQ